ncbi:hypothetical protein [Roseicyclus persicicus]|uniref:Uncharacterized protein n=1 Tax=Roseicyclus persicicus TaxID=2650661 RepID=A0A7X6JYP1_9RHOB|nr:hypothetical protein [Roseibacterium persicicum]NKX44320.1 hypothetical protein [Roseibacterium persicicum]
MRRGLILPLAGLVTAAGAFGLWQGLRAVPPTETEIILAAAARYVAETGGAATDCAGRPAAVEGVRLVVTCGADWALAVDLWGRPVALPGAGPRT